MTATSPPVRRLSRRATMALVVGALLLVVLVLGIINVGRHSSSRATTSQPSHVSYSSQVVLPFTYLDAPFGAALDTAGNLYVTDHSTHQVLKLAPGASAPMPLPSTGLKNPTGVAVDTAGNV